MTLKYDKLVDYYTWESDDTPEKLSPFFSTREFESKDRKCYINFIRGDLIKKLTAVREEIKLPIKVTSGYRTADDQRRLKKAGIETAKGTSTHELGEAADITCSNMDLLLEVCSKHFKSIGIAKTFLHVDLRMDKVRRWKYK